METLDVRKYPHAERPKLILEKLKDVDELEIIVEMKPVPVIQMLEAQGYNVEARQEGGVWRVKIKRA